MAKKKKYQLDMDASEALEAPKSRSQKKRDSHALKDIGGELIQLSAGQLKRIPLNEDLQEALKIMAKITDNEGRRRQKQYIGKLMRECDPRPIQEALEQLKQGHTADTNILHHAERLRETLLGENTQESERIFAQFPEAESTLRALVDKAKGMANPETQGAKRTLFKELRKLLEK